MHIRQHPLPLTSVKMKGDTGKPNTYLEAVIVLDVESAGITYKIHLCMKNTQV